jgi:uncharacterized membrane protein YkoI
VKIRATLMTAAGLALALAAAPAMAQQAPTKAPATTTPKLKQARPGLLNQATVKPDSAQSIAMGEVPGGKITSSELKERSHKLVYDFRITPSGGGHSKEVLVDAKTGEIVHLGATMPKAKPAAKPAAKPTTPPATKPDTAKKP